MFEHQRRIYEFNLFYAEKLADELSETQLDWQPAADVHPARWVLVHLALSTDYAGKLLGLKRQCPKEWHASYGPGSPAVDASAPKPTKVELLESLRTGHQRIADAVAGVDAATLEQPHGVVFMESSPLTTKGDLLSHLMTSHEATHLGQLSILRRQLGFSPLF